MFALCRPKIRGLLQGEHPEILAQWPTPCWFERRRHSIANCGRMVTDSATVTMESPIGNHHRPSSWIISNGHISATAHSIHLYSASRGHLCDSTAFLLCFGHTCTAKMMKNISRPTRSAGRSTSSGYNSLCIVILCNRKWIPFSKSPTKQDSIRSDIQRFNWLQTWTKINTLHFHFHFRSR